MSGLEIKTQARRGYEREAGVREYDYFAGNGVAAGAAKSAVIVVGDVEQFRVKAELPALERPGFFSAQVESLIRANARDGRWRNRGKSREARSVQCLGAQANRWSEAEAAKHVGGMGLVLFRWVIGRVEVIDGQWRWQGYCIEAEPSLRVGVTNPSGKAIFAAALEEKLETARMVST